MNENMPELTNEFPWSEIVDNVIKYYAKDREGNMFGMHGKKAYPVASLAFLHTDASKYKPKDLSQAFQGISEHLYASIKNGTAKIGTLGKPINPDELAVGESPSVDIALGRAETSPAELGKMMFENMYELSMDDERYHYNFQHWKGAAQDAISFMESGIEVIPDNPHQSPDY